MKATSLSVKVAVPLALAVTLLTLVVAGTATYYRRRAVTRVAQQRAESFVGVTLNTINAVTPEGHRPDIQPFLEVLARNPDVTAVRVLAADGRVVRSARREEVGRLVKIAPGTNGASGPGAVVEVVEPIQNEPRCHSCHGRAQTLGSLQVALLVAAEGSELYTWHTVSTITSVLQLVALTLLTGALSSYLISRPVRRLAAAMQRVKAGDLDVRVEPVGTVEIDHVIDGFNTMVARLKDGARAEEEARRLQMQRAEQLATTGQLAAGLAHEIRNPVAGVKAAVEVLSGQMPEGDPRRAILRESASELNRVDDVIKDLLHYARPRRPEPARVSLGQIVRDAVMLTSGEATVRGVTVALDAGDERTEIVADVGMVRQIVVNLLLNAIEATAGKDPASVHATVSFDGGEVVCTVRDNGAGVTAEDAQRVFTPFFTTKAKGTGLGLATSRRLAELQNGRLWLQNPGSPGASFAVAFAAAPRQEAVGAA